jgi:hypothetical protein
MSSCQICAKIPFQTTQLLPYNTKHTNITHIPIFELKVNKTIGEETVIDQYSWSKMYSRRQRNRNFVVNIHLGQIHTQQP